MNGWLALTIILSVLFICLTAESIAKIIKGK